MHSRSFLLKHITLNIECLSQVKMKQNQESSSLRTINTFPPVKLVVCPVQIPSLVFPLRYTMFHSQRSETHSSAFQCIPRINVPPRMKYINPPKAHSFKISFPQPAPKPHQSDPDLPTPTFSVLHLDRHYHHPEGNGERRHRHPCVKRRRRKFLTFWCVSLL